MENLIHLVFDGTGAERLKESFALDDIIRGEVLVFEDDLAFGPLKKRVPEGEGPARQQWWDNLEEAPYPALEGDTEKLIELRQKMRGDASNEIWIWAAQNARDVSCYYGMLEPLEEFIGRIHLIYLNNLPFINDKGGLFYPVRLGEILPREFLKARKLAREITPAEYEVDTEEWRRLKEEGAPVRILEGGKKLRSETEDFFDKELTGRCRLEYMKGWRLVSQVGQKLKDHVSEPFLYWRLATLLASGALALREAGRPLRDAEFKAPAGSGEAAPENPLPDGNTTA